LELVFISAIREITAHFVAEKISCDKEMVVKKSK
jgi:hypothetical protein